MHHLEQRDTAHPQQDIHRRVMHKRQRAAATTEATTTAAVRTTTTRRRAATTTATPAVTAVESAADLVAPTSTSSSFQPGVAASGTATRSVGDTPPTRIRTHTSASYSYSFAAESSGVPRSSTIAGNSSSGSAAAATTGLPTGAIYGIAIGGGVLAVAILAGIGFCCWKKRKARKADDNLGWTNLGDNNGRRGPPSKPIELGSADAWASNDALAPGSGPYGGGAEKPWAQQSLSSLASYDEKGRGGPQSHTLPVFAPQNHQAARDELLGCPPARSATEQSFPRSATGASLASVPHPHVGGDRARPATGAQSVNDVITFPGQAGPQAPAAATVAQPSPAHLPSRNSPSSSPTAQSNVPLPPSTPQQQQQQPQAARPSQPAHLSFNGVPVGPQPIVASAYPPRRPMRPSEVPSVGAVSASPYAFARRPEQAQRDTQELASDDRLEGRFMEVMTGQVGRDEGESGRRARSKKDTIVGLADAYGGEEGSDDDEDEQRDRVERLPSPPSAATTRATPSSNPRRYSARVDSKPLRELEAMFEQLPTSSSHHHHAVRASEASDLSGLAAAAGVRLGGSSSPSYRASDASSMYAPPAPVAPLALTRRPLGPVPESDSKDSLSPLSAAAAATESSGAHSPYGETKRYEHSIYSAAGEVGEMSSNSIAGSARSTPAKQGGGPAGSTPSSPLVQQRPPAPRVAQQAPSSSVDIFGPSAIQPPARKSSVKAAPLQRKVSTRPAAPAPLRLARNASLAHQQQQPRAREPEPSTPSAADERKNPLTLSTAERDVLQQLGLPGTPELSSSSPRSSPGSSPSSVASSSLATPQTPVFHFSHPSTTDHTVRSFMDVSPSPSPSRDGSFAPQQRKAPQIVVVDPVASGGFDSLAVMAGKQGQQDASYRSATMSLYGMYE